ncbi:MAG TPA: toxin C-terminal domain-containing protein [Jatrophihabitantaceae bacterium]
MAKGGGRAAKGVARAVAKEEKNFIWKACEGIFRPVKTDAFEQAEKDALKKGRKLDDPRAGHPTHRTSEPRVPKPKQRELAGELGYEPYQPRGGAPKEPIFHNPNGEPPYISYDHTGHGSADRSGELPPNVAWKGANDPKTLMNRGRDGTYVPKYDSNGNVHFDRVRD